MEGFPEDFVAVEVADAAVVVVVAAADAADDLVAVAAAAAVLLHLVGRPHLLDVP